MSVFNHERLDDAKFQTDIYADRLASGWYSDAYFGNIVKILETLSEEGYTFQGDQKRLPDGVEEVQNGDIVVEMQFFTRRKPFSLVAGVDEALSILRNATGYYKNGAFINTYDQLEVEAVEDGTFAAYDGNPLHVQPVLKVRGRYRDFAKLETPILGALAEPTRIATNVYNTLVAAGGKDVLFFPARFAPYKLQGVHGYAYSLAVQAYNVHYHKQAKTFVSTDDQGGWWGGKGGGTIAHASIASFFGDTAETMLQFSRIMSPSVPRIALIDFDNDCGSTTLDVMEKMWRQFWNLYRQGKKEEAEKYRLYAVRPDTSGNMRDQGLPPLGDKSLDMGVNPRLVWMLREAIDRAYVKWEVPLEATEVAEEWCRGVKIVVTGGFSTKKIREFEDLGVPVDIYGVGSSLLENSAETNNDYTADIVRVRLDEQWFPMAKVGRGAASNPNLQLISAPPKTAMSNSAA